MVTFSFGDVAVSAAVYARGVGSAGGWRTDGVRFGRGAVWSGVMWSGPV